MRLDTSFRVFRRSKSGRWAHLLAWFGMSVMVLGCAASSYQRQLIEAFDQARNGAFEKGSPPSSAVPTYFMDAQPVHKARLWTVLPDGTWKKSVGCFRSPASLMPGPTSDVVWVSSAEGLARVDMKRDEVKRLPANKVIRRLEARHPQQPTLLLAAAGKDGEDGQMVRLAMSLSEASAESWERGADGCETPQCTISKWWVPRVSSNGRLSTMLDERGAPWLVASIPNTPPKWLHNLGLLKLDDWVWAGPQSNEIFVLVQEKEDCP